MKKSNNIKNDIYKMYGGRDIVKTLDNLNKDLKITFDENIYFTKTIIDEINKLSLSNTEFTQKTRGQFDELNSNLQNILKKIIEFKEKYEKDVTNKELSSYDQYINQVNTIKDFVVETFNESSMNDYLTLKLSESPVFVKEQINVGNITGPLSEIIKKVSTNIEALQKDIQNKTIDGSQKNIEEQMNNIKIFLANFDNEIGKIKETTEHLQRLNREFKNYMEVNLNEDMIKDVIFNTPECVDKDMISFSNIDTSQSNNEKEKEDLNLLQTIDTNDLGKYLIDATILSSLVQTGGSTDRKTRFPEALKTRTNKSVNESINDYYQQLMTINIKVSDFKKFIGEFKKISMEYNIRYIQVYHHLLFIVNYLKLISMNSNSNYLVYQYLGRGSVTYYLRIVDRILNDIKNKKTSSIGKYFYKYHYININILKIFLEFLNKNWQPYSNSCNVSGKDLLPGSDKQITAKRITLSKMYLLSSKYDPPMKKCIFIFNSMKDILDKYYSEFSPPVGIYLRINDWTPKVEKDIVFAKDSNNNLGFIDRKSLEKCTNSQNELKTYQNEIDKASQVKFQEVFDPEGFDSNDVLAKYMSIPSFLQEGKSIMLITYGYSGVGKTFTIFGSRNPQLDGVLQSSLSNIQQKKSLYYRSYEIYGLAVPYDLYWDRSTDDYYHFIYDYSDLNNIKTYDSKTMKEYLDDINESPKSGNTSFIELTEEKLKNFSDIVGAIDEKRKEKGTIKRTINNRESSRSIMVYDFKVELNNNTFVNFVVMDLPGKEHITETFIKPPPENEYKCITIKNNYGLSEELLKKMAYFSPASLALNDGISNMIIKEYNKKSFDLVFNYLGKIVDKNNSNYNSINDKMKSENERRYALEIMRNIIQFNKFDLLKSIYNNIFSYPEPNDSNYKTNEKYKCSTHDSYSITPFEGYYINENITGLISTLLNNLKLNNNFVQTQKTVYSPLFNELVEKPYYDKNGVPEIERIKDPNLQELIAQTYFFRNFIYQNNNVVSYYTNNDTYNGRPFREWLESDDIYDFNKSYRKDNPPIATILKPYFNIIKNFYVFYVVSNENKDKCEKQIKFIADSNDFLIELGKFNPEVYKKTISNR